MKHDNPDTIAMDETHWAATHVDDVFLPSVRVQLGWSEVEGAVVPQHAHALWAGWAAPTSGLRVGASGLARAFEPTQSDSVHHQPDLPAEPGALQKYGLLLGLVVGVLLGAGGAFLALG